MAYVIANRSAQNTMIARVLAATSGIQAALRQRQVYLRTVTELNALTDREMADLGIHRALVKDIAHEAAYGLK